MRPFRALTPFLAIPSAALLVSCAGGQEASPPAAAAAPVIGVVLMQQDQFFRLNEAGMREAAKRLGADLRVQNAGGALDKEASIVETFTSQKVGAIVVSPLSSEGSVPALRRARDAGIRIVTYNNALAADFVDFAVSSDQASLGAESGRAAKTHIESHLGGTARVAIIGFSSQLPEQGDARQMGFKSAIRGLSGVTIVAEQDAWEAAQATNTVGELLAKKPDVVWAANEGGTVGAVTAVRNAGLAGHVTVFGTDMSAQLLDFLEAPDGILQAVTAQAPVEMGASAIEAAVRAIRGERVEPAAVLPGKLYARGDSASLAAARKSLEAAAQ
jgi:ABC-type sugar transport system substrate-binding protein